MQAHAIPGERAHHLVAPPLPAAIRALVLPSPAAGNLYVGDTGNNRVERRVVIEVAKNPAGADTHRQPG